MGKDNSKKSNKSKTIRDAPYSINHFDEDDTDDGDEQTQWSFDSQTHEDNNCTNNSTTPEKRKRISGTTIVSKGNRSIESITQANHLLLTDQQTINCAQNSLRVLSSTPQEVRRESSMQQLHREGC
eukprot:GEZU01017396.1.p1 GENE.GEZU01017396.1~~GEZU01017396.1.p1  ORF type:complete len:126 (+),score=16.65 GEZU01017396.1:137-514(+)